MALQTSGAISLADIQTEFGGTNPISLSEYYAAASGIPASGTISISQFYGKSSGPPELTATQSSYWFSSDAIFRNGTFGNKYLFKNSDFVSALNASNGAELAYYSAAGSKQWHKNFDWGQGANFYSTISGNKYGDTLLIGYKDTTELILYFALIQKDGTVTATKSLTVSNASGFNNVQRVCVDSDSNGDFICAFYGLLFKISRSNGSVTTIKDFSNAGTTLTLKLDSNDDAYWLFGNRIVLKLSSSSNYAVSSQFDVGNVSELDIDGNDNLYIGSPSGVEKYNSSMTFQWGRAHSSSTSSFQGLAALDDGALIQSGYVEFSKFGTFYSSYWMYLTPNGNTMYFDSASVDNGHGSFVSNYDANCYLVVSNGEIAQVRPLGYPNQSGFDIYDLYGSLSTGTPQSKVASLSSAAISVTASTWSTTVSDVNITGTTSVSAPANLTKTAFNAYP